MSESPDVPTMATILDYLNEDCWRAVLHYVTVRDIITTERTSHRWQDVVLTYLRSARIVIKESFHDRVTEYRGLTLTPSDGHLTSFESWTNKLGPSIVSARCSRNRTLKLISNNCPNLEDITIPVDYCISQLMCNDTLEELEIIYSRRFTGQCLTNTQWTNLKTLVLNGHIELQSRHLLAATCLGHLTSFELRKAENEKIYEEIHVLLNKMPNLERLYVEGGRGDSFLESVSRLRHLKNLWTDFEATDGDLAAVTRQCPELKILRLDFNAYRF